MILLNMLVFLRIRTSPTFARIHVRYSACLTGDHASSATQEIADWIENNNDIGVNGLASGSEIVLIVGIVLIFLL